MARSVDLLVVGNPQNRRVDHFQQALRARGWAPARVVAHADLLSGRASLADHLRPGTVVRLESTGEEDSVERQILSEGGIEDAASIPPERGRILHPAAWLRGFSRYMARLARAGDDAGVGWFNHPSEILLMFDKPRCKEHLGDLSLPTLGRFATAAEFFGHLREHRIASAFVKLPGSSSASGVAAFRCQPSTGRQVLRTTLEMRRIDGEVRFYNSLRPQVYRDSGEIREVLDFLFSQGAFAEPWLAKPMHQGMAWDLRVLAVAGHARHRLARLSKGPMTNLHLGNRRLDPALLDLSPEDWNGVENAVEQTMRRFPRSLYAGLDMVVARSQPGAPSRVVVLEVNAFGDLLPGVLRDGLDPWQSQLDALARREGFHG